MFDIDYIINDYRNEEHESMTMLAQKFKEENFSLKYSMSMAILLIFNQDEEYLGSVIYGRKGGGTFNYKIEREFIGKKDCFYLSLNAERNNNEMKNDEFNNINSDTVIEKIKERMSKNYLEQ